MFVWMSNIDLTDPIIGRRVTPGDPYMEAIQKENVDVHFTAVDEITETGLIGNDGVERKVDTIVCATGFDVTFRPRFPIIGRNGVNLQDKWKDEPESYLGLACPDMPNFIMFGGPTWYVSHPSIHPSLQPNQLPTRPVENGSVTGPFQAVTNYTLQILSKMQLGHIKSWAPSQSITTSFNAHAQEWIKHTVWKSDCRSWYRNNETGRVNAIWPGSSNHYMEVIAAPRWEDFEIEYMHKDNMWAFLGIGYAVCNVKFPDSDVSPYLAMEKVDPKWLEAIGYKEAAGEVRRVREGKEEPDVKRTAEDAGVRGNTFGGA